MFLIDDYSTPGEHALMLDGPVGILEAALCIPNNLHHPYVALLGHPHSLQGGTMNNKVVTTMARALQSLGIPSLRFNFRGVGQSAGVYDHGLGESEDMVFLAQEWQKKNPQARFIFAGFSFGSYVTYRTAAQCSALAALISIAPPVHHYDYNEFVSPAPWLIVQGTEDDVVPATLVHDFVAQSDGTISLVDIPEAGHFFHGKLIELKSHLLEYLRLVIA